MYCPICGEEVNLSQSQCPSCGTNLDWSDHQENNFQNEEINSDNNIQTSNESNSYYKDINKNDPFAPNAGFNSVDYDVPETNADQQFERSSGSVNSQPLAGGNYQSDDLQYDYYDSEEENKQRKRFIWLLLGAGIVILLLTLLFVLISRKNKGREVGPNLSNSVSELSISSSTSEKSTTSSTTEQSESSQSLVQSSNKNEIVYVTPTPAPTPTPTTTVATTTTTKAPTTTTTKATSKETTTASTVENTTTSSTDSSIDNSSKETDPKQTTTDNTQESTPTSTTFASDHETYLRLNSGDLPVEPNRFGDPDKPGDTAPTGEILPDNNSESKKLSSFINESLQNINSPVYNGAQVQDRTVQLPNFSHISQVPSELWIETYLNQFLKTVKGSTNPFDTKEFKLKEIEEFLQKNVNPEIKLDPNSPYNVPPYEYRKDDDGTFSIPDTAIEPNEEITENPESKTTFVPIETVKLKNGNYEVRMIELNYDLRTHEDVNYRVITDLRHQKVIGLAIDSTKSVAQTADDITNDGDTVFFMNIEEMKANLGYVKYTLTPGSNGNLTLVSKISYAANASNSDVLDRISEIEDHIYSNLDSSSVKTAEKDIPLMNNPKTADADKASQIGTIRKDSQYLVFNIGSDSQFIALTSAGDGDLIGYIDLMAE